MTCNLRTVNRLTTTITVCQTVQIVMLLWQTVSVSLYWTTLKQVAENVSHVTNSIILWFEV